jgi:hypothetical protein
MPHVPSSSGQYPVQGYAHGEFESETDTGEDYEGDRYLGGGYANPEEYYSAERREHHPGRRIPNFDPYEEQEEVESEPDYEGIMERRNEARGERIQEYWDRKY